MSDQKKYEYLRDLCLNGQANQSEMNRLGDYLSSSPEFLNDYVEHAQQESTLQWYGDSNHTSESTVNLPAQRNSWSVIHAVFVTVASVVFLLFGGWGLSKSLQDKSVAILTTATNCRWETGSLPTSLGERMPPGRLRLSSGIAQVDFPKVTVTLEGPVDLEIISSDRCRLYSGRLVGLVEPGGEGFVVETPYVEITDRGTKFGVTVDPAGNAKLDVLQGKVDVRHLKSGRTLTADRSHRVEASGKKIEFVSNRGDPATSDVQELDRGKVMYVSTSDGVGDEANVAFGNALAGSDFSRPPHILLAKHSESDPNWDRKIILRFDLSNLKNEQLNAAELRLDGVATGMGYASLIPDARFAVFGLREEQEANWDPDLMKWENAPGSLTDSTEIDLEKVILLGHFMAPQSQPELRFVVDDPRLKTFLQDDSDSVVTIIIACLTTGTEIRSYVHGFASRSHPTASPPTLRIQKQ